ncbi:MULTISPECIES: PLP-dependent aminotransferase family protein [unclassified Rummeliibacillus]|uniref:MocR-like pyridoxine biosynthesis transcription factor PdxR n=1 Tax=unclassified Rummeliibacillus TaxID=2622809 RepID=UPI000E66F68A|nr:MULTISPECIES: PLP-dependent aminotransferase family protein [unclassified Rummeliibacillus]RIJ63395.1 PLP-dependent aminotransferase family protein [Rummeliibacillus sp. POC4]RPJ95636.1 PLP-dependent aminotransferase family protein [Rummeliibacillus sp. TYF005]
MNFLKLHFNEGIPKYQQIYTHFKDLILHKSLNSNEKLPFISQITNELNVSRGTVVSALNQLTAEGYLRHEVNKGYFVNPIKNNQNRWKRDTYTFVRKQIPSYKIKFQPTAVDQESFPIVKWRQCTNLAMEQPFIFSKDHYQGDPFLRQQLSFYLLKSRKINTNAHAIIIGSTKQELLIKVGLLLKNDVQTIICEDPGFEPTRIFNPLFNFDVLPIPFTMDGKLLKQLPKGKQHIFHTTPSHQFPTGVTMPIYERQRLIDWAYNTNSYIIEDDYDSEFRYTEQPIPALASQDLNRVIYLGSFTESFLPTLRISYMILPPKLLKKYHQAFSHIGQSASAIHQRAMAIFMEDGYWDSHLRKMRSIYKSKMETLIAAIEKSFENEIDIVGKESGLYVLLRVKNGYTEQQLIQKAAENGVKVYAASRFFINRTPKFPLIQIGFGGNSEEEIIKGIEILGESWT